MPLLERLKSWLSPPAVPQRATVLNKASQAVLMTDAPIADTSPTRRTGLLKHTELLAGDGLWIVPCSGVHTFRMKFPIDVVFLDKRYCVRKIVPAMPRSRIAVCLRADSVLELPAGTAAASATQVGDQLQIRVRPVTKMS